MTTLSGEAPATRLGDAMERLDPAPAAVGVVEVEDGSGLWEVGGHFVAPPDQAGLALLAAIHDARPFAVSRVEDTDWVAQVRRELTPVEAGRFVLYGAHDADRIGAHRLGLRIEAAMAFGTGHHGTTRGCLMLLEEMIRQAHRPTSAADIGCGTGVLAMAAVRALRIPVIASDIDPLAVSTARENLTANGLRPWVRTVTAAGFRNPLFAALRPFDLIFANILAAPLKRLAPDIARHLTPGGSAILSGLLTRQAAGVEAVFRGHGFRRAATITLGDWTSLRLERA